MVGLCSMDSEKRRAGSLDSFTTQLLFLVNSPGIRVEGDWPMWLRPICESGELLIWRELGGQSAAASSPLSAIQDGLL